METLPADLIRQFLLKYLHPKDALNFLCVSKKIYNTTNEKWRHKIWARLYRLLNNHDPLYLNSYVCFWNMSKRKCDDIGCKIIRFRHYHIKDAIICGYCNIHQKIPGSKILDHFRGEKTCNLCDWTFQCNGLFKQHITTKCAGQIIYCTTDTLSDNGHQFACKFKSKRCTMNRHRISKTHQMTCINCNLEIKINYNPNGRRRQFNTPRDTTTKKWFWIDKDIQKCSHPIRAEWSEWSSDKENRKKKFYGKLKK